MDQLKHFAHKHPLLLCNDEGNDEGEKEKCTGCGKPVSGGTPSFRCPDCKNFLLHKSCAELPEEIEHHGHPEHPLNLVYVDQIPNHIYICDACETRGPVLFYNCSPCKFSLDIGCAQLAQTIQHPGHQQHPLTLQLKKADFCCDACGLSHREKGFAYQCSTCHFWVHEECICLPSTVQHRSHSHLLTLACALRLDSELSRFSIFCDVCGMAVKPKNCLYYCAGCRFFADVDCALLTFNFIRGKSDTEAEDHSPNLLCLPMPDESGSLHLVKQLLEQVSLLGSNESGRELKHCICGHQLILYDAEIDEICDACVRPISAPYYNCPECNFIQHKSCAELPSEIQHPLHEKHPLSLINCKSFECKACEYLCNGFAYHCALCRFFLDIKCASLPIAIRHEAHEHLLNLKQTFSSRCGACYQALGRFVFRCIDCNFNLHIECALLPRTLAHRYDRHALTLKRSPVGIMTDEYYCEICEGELNPKLWFYYCGDCDYAFHSKCICKAADDYANVKFGAIINVMNHPHSLILARMEKHKVILCDHCGDPCENISFQCKDCQFNLHFLCAPRLRII